MKQFSISAAAKEFKRSRNTIRDHLKSGKLSYAQDGKNIDLSELLRVYGPIPNQSNESVQTVPLDQPIPLSQKDIEIASLRAEVKGLERLLEEREKRILLITSIKKPWWKRVIF
jgi:hypothetical protein